VFAVCAEMELWNNVVARIIIMELILDDILDANIIVPLF